MKLLTTIFYKTFYVAVLFGTFFVLSLSAAFVSRHQRRPTHGDVTPGKKTVIHSAFPDDLREISLDVSWLPKPRYIEKNEEFEAILKPNLKKIMVENLATIFLDEMRNRTYLYESGEVARGPYRGSRIYFWIGRYSYYDEFESKIGHQPYNRLLRFPDGSLRLLTRYDRPGSYEGTGYDMFFQQASNIKISSLEMPEEPVLSTGRRLQRTGAGGVSWNRAYVAGSGGPSLLDLGEVVATTDGGVSLYPVLTDEYNERQKAWGGCVFASLPDGELYWYDARIPTDATGYSYYEQERKNNLLIIWEKGFENDDRYQPYSFVGNVPRPSCPEIVSDEQVGPASGLVRAGITVDGDPVFTPKDPTRHPLTVQAFNFWDGEWQIHSDPDKQRPTMRQFFKEHPAAVFFWKNSFGKWIRYTSFDIIPPLD